MIKYFIIIISLAWAPNIMCCEIAQDSEKNELLDILSKNLAQEATSIRNTTPVSDILIKYPDEDKNVIGAISGYMFYGSVVIDMLWVHNKHRNKGIGKMLVSKLEEISFHKGAKFSTVTTMDWWNTQSFYESQGYKLEFTRNGYQNNSKQYSYIKYF